jgi:hypothetical protein
MGLGAARKNYTKVAAVVRQAVNGVLVDVDVEMDDWELTSENYCSKTGRWAEQKEMTKIDGSWYSTVNTAAKDEVAQKAKDKFTFPGPVENEGDYRR